MVLLQLESQEPHTVAPEALDQRAVTTDAVRGFCNQEATCHLIPVLSAS